MGETALAEEALSLWQGSVEQSVYAALSPRREALTQALSTLSQTPDGFHNQTHRKNNFILLDMLHISLKRI